MVEERIRIVLIEDNAGDARLLQVYLDQMPTPVELTWRTRLDEALEHVAEHGCDLALLDLTLPDADGNQCIERIRSHFPDVPVVILSDTEDPRLAVDALRRGAEDFLFKGALDSHLLTRSIQYVMQRVRSQAELRRANALLAATLEATADGILVVDSDGRVVGFNSQFASMWGVTEDDLRSGDDERIRKLLIAPLEDPASFLEGTLPERTSSEWSSDIIRFSDGRIIERFAKPHVLDGEVLGRVWSFRDVTMERQARRALEAEKERFRGLMESAPDALIIVDQNGLIVLVNNQAQRMFGYERSELIGQPVEALVPLPLRESHVHQRRTYTADPKARPMGMGMDLRAVRKDGSEFPVEISLAPIRTDRGMLVSAAVRDMSEHKRVAEQVRRNSQRLAEAQAIAHIGSWEWDVAQDRVVWSDELYRIYGVPLGEPMSYTRFISMVHPEDKDRADRIIRDSLERGVGFSFVHRVVRDGEDRLIQARGQVEREPHGAVVRMVGTGQDITEQKQAEEALEESYRLMAKNEKLAALGTLIAGVAHEINNPLAFVKSNEQVFDAMLQKLAQGTEEEREALVERLRRLLQTNKGGIERIEAIVRSLRQVARPSTGERQTRDLVDLVRDTLPVLEPVRREHNAELDLVLPEGQVPVLVNATEISQVILNLVKNAFEVSPSGGVVRVTVRPAVGGGAHVVVDDQGPGVPEADLPQVFDPFFTTKPTGTGLGLSISAKIVESHGGSLSCENIDGAGARFTLSLPSPAKAPKVEHVAEPPPATARR